MRHAPPRPRVLRVAWAFAGSALLHLALFAAIDPPDLDRMERAEGASIDVRLLSLPPPRPVAARAAPAPAPIPDLLRLPAVAQPAPQTRVAAKPSRSAQAPAAKPRPVPSADTLRARALAAAAAEAFVSAPSPDGEAPPATAVAAPATSTDIDLAAAFPAMLELEYSIREAGDATVLGWMVHRFERDGDRYRIRSTIEATGLVALFVQGRYDQRSEGRLTAGGLQPERFSVRRGRHERVERAVFDWAAARATLSDAQGAREWAIEAGAQDQLSLVHQLAYLMGTQEPPRVLVTNGRRFETARIEVLGSETVDTDLGPIEAVHVRSALERGTGFELWLAPQHGYLPVRLRLRDKRGREADQVLASLKVKW